MRNQPYQTTGDPPKLQLVDTGLVNFVSGYQADLFNFNDINQSFLGRNAEHITGQELLTLSDSVIFALNYWTREKKDATAMAVRVYSGQFAILPFSKLPDYLVYAEKQSGREI